MADRIIYFRDVDRENTVVRKKPDRIHLEVSSARHPQWWDTYFDSSYEREFYLGQGNNCLFEISFEKAKELLTGWGVELTEEDR